MASEAIMSPPPGSDFWKRQGGIAERKPGVRILPADNWTEQFHEGADSIQKVGGELRIFKAGVEVASYPAGSYVHATMF